MARPTKENRMSDLEKLIWRHLVLDDANFICQLLDIPPDVAKAACDSWKRLSESFGQMVLSDRNRHEFDRAEINIINALTAEAQKHD